MSYITKARKHMSTSEFKQLERYGLTSMIRALIQLILCAYVLKILFSAFKFGVQTVAIEVKNQLPTFGGTAEDIQIIYNNILSILLFFLVLPTALIFIVKYLESKDFRKLYFVFFLTIVVLFSASLTPARAMSDQSEGTYLMMLLYVFSLLLMTRLQYLTKLRLLMQIGLLEYQPTKIIGRNRVNSLIRNENELHQINHSWRPYIDVTMNSKSLTQLDSEWEREDTNTEYTFIVQSKFSGVFLNFRCNAIQHYITQHIEGDRLE